ncbi:aromatic amino acid hydroxylase [Falsibacillus pallidus]|uniref:aromatic amino acid hydroxylase n=1 Tax=Falsibacillus pallidus TaxID=493781 RepID=UPI003CCC8046
MTATKKIPRHLQKYVVDQQYEKYSPIDQAVWRYVMRQNHHFLKDAAHPAYTGGLKSSGISIERIPNVDDMNEALSPFGWGAANIDGFIPGVVFFDFQAHGILPIASDIRKLENIQYTPAPDIIHEAAGHAPILCEEKFSEYVKLFGEIGSKALATKEEHDLFEAVRTYSNLLESGSATKEQIEQAEAEVEKRQASVVELSEAEQISRLYWWTVEYGMIGTVEDPKIYGAGLLSSVSEGRNSLSPSVKKIPFDLEKVINTSFDITKPQPQLFVCESFEQLIDAVKEFRKTMASHTGGTASLETALRSGHTATFQFSSGLQVTGTLETIEKDGAGEAVYMKTVGPTALAFENKEIIGHGKSHHFDGFGAPIGKLENTECPLEEMNDQQLKSLGIEEGADCRLSYESGVVVEGIVKKILKKNDSPILISFTDCRVQLGDKVLFDPSWGEFDLAVGEKVVSVFAGAADSEQFYADLEEVEQKPFEKREWTPLEQLYGEVREMRNNGADIPALQRIIGQLTSEFPHDWLLRVEIMEILRDSTLLLDEQELISKQLEEIKILDEEWKVLIERGLKLAE